MILAALQLRDEQFRNWMFRRMEEIGETPAEQIIAMFDTMAEWFAKPDYRGCMFIKALAEYQEANHPIHAQAAEHKRLLFNHISKLAQQAGAGNPETLARQLMLLKEGVIVTAHLGHTPDPAGDAKDAARQLLETAIG